MSSETKNGKLRTEVKMPPLFENAVKATATASTKVTFSLSGVLMLESLRQGDGEFQANLAYVLRSRLGEEKGSLHL